MKLTGEIAGYVAIVFSMLIYQQKSRKGLLIFKAASDILWITHYFLLGGYTGAVVTAVALVRTAVFFRNEKHDKKGRCILVGFLCISVICSILTWGNVYSIFALLGSMLSIVSFWIGKPKISRIMVFPISSCMLIYGVSKGSVAVLINELLVMISAIIGILHHDRKKQN